MFIKYNFTKNYYNEFIESIGDNFKNITIGKKSILYLLHL